MAAGNRKQVAVIGGGAAGLMAAIAAARQGANVIIYEAADRVGKKLLRTGNGRCNYANERILPLKDYHNGEFVAQVQAAAPIDPIMELERLGLWGRADDAGRLYPLSNKANSVLNVLRMHTARLGVQERCDFPVADIRLDPSGVRPPFIVSAQDGRFARADALVLAPGGDSNALWRLFSHPTVKCHPVLAPLATASAPIKGLSDIRIQASAKLTSPDGSCKAQDSGELLFRDYGVSGIMVFDLSRYASAGDMLHLDLLPDFDAFELLDRFKKRLEAGQWPSAVGFLEGIFHERVSQAVCRAAHIAPNAPATSIDLAELVMVIKDFPLLVRGIGDAKQAQAMRGGATVDAFDPVTLESRLVPGLHGAGESLDVDGRCGGFNLYWAWLSGLVAGTHAGQPDAD